MSLKGRGGGVASVVTLVVNSPGASGNIVSGNFIVSGSSTGVQSVQAWIGAGSPVVATGVTSWYAELSTVGLSGTQTVSVQGYDVGGNPIILRTISIVIGAAATVTQTFHSVGFYWTAAGGGSGVTATPYVRPAGTSTWEPGFPLWWDARTTVGGTAATPQYRGSIVLLNEDTQYEAKVVLSSGPVTVVSFRTWTDNPVIQSTTTLTSGTTGSPTFANYTISVGGSVVGGVEQYVKYVPTSPSSNVIDGSGGNDCLLVTASYVVIDGFVLKNALRNGIELAAGVHHVRIQNCDISGWGKEGDGTAGSFVGFGYPLDSAVYGYGGVTNTINQIVVQRCTIHDPRWSANWWDNPGPSTHPAGPMGIMIDADVTLGNTIGNNVYRYNTFTCSGSTTLNFYKCVAGSNNQSRGGFGNDMDCYQNFFADVADDAIEADGGGRNTRIWANYITRTFSSISVNPVSVGPAYLFRNVADIHRLDPANDPDDGNHGDMFKVGCSSSTWVGGRCYIFHNTALQADPPVSKVRTRGTQTVVDNTDTFCTEYQTLNNILHAYLNSGAEAGAGLSMKAAADATNIFDYDMYTGTNTLSGATDGGHITHAAPVYATGNGDNQGSSGKYRLNPGAAGSGTGASPAVGITGFNTMYATPDKGAAQTEAPDFTYGITATSWGG